MVAGRDFAASEVNLATGDGGAGGFPAGSSFKVFYLIAALEQGWTPTTTLDAPSPRATVVRSRLAATRRDQPSQGAIPNGGGGASTSRPSSAG